MSDRSEAINRIMETVQREGLSPNNKVAVVTNTTGATALCLQSSGDAVSWATPSGKVVVEGVVLVLADPRFARWVNIPTLVLQGMPFKQDAVFPAIEFMGQMAVSTGVNHTRIILDMMEYAARMDGAPCDDALEEYMRRCQAVCASPQFRGKELEGFNFPYAMGEPGAWRPTPGGFATVPESFKIPEDQDEAPYAFPGV